MEIGQLVLEIQAVEGLQRQQETKKLKRSVCLYLKISICELRGSLSSCSLPSVFVQQTNFVTILHIQLEVVSKTFLDFPAVTVCNTNKVRRSAIMESKHKQVLTIDDNTPTAYQGNYYIFTKHILRVPEKAVSDIWSVLQYILF